MAGSHSSDRFREYFRLAALVLGRDRLAAPRRIDVPVRKAEDRGAETSAYIQHLCWVAAAAYGIVLPSMVVRFARMTGGAACIDIEGGICFIDVDPEHAYDDERLTAILGHEVAHLALNAKRVVLEPVLRNEELTDALTALAGFGPIMLSAKVRERSFGFRSRTTLRSQIGYLSSSAIMNLLAMQARVVPRRYGVRHTPWRAEQGPWSCDVCGTPTNLPKISATIVVRCRTCGRRMQLRLRDGDRVGGLRSWLGIARARWRDWRGPIDRLDEIGGGPAVACDSCGRNIPRAESMVHRRQHYCRQCFESNVPSWRRVTRD